MTESPEEALQWHVVSLSWEASRAEAGSAPHSLAVRALSVGLVSASGFHEASRLEIRLLWLRVMHIAGCGQGHRSLGAVSTYS